MSQITLNGGCLCGAIRYEISGDADRCYHCHCQRCRKASGTGHATNLIVRPESVTWLEGEALLSHYKVPDAQRFTNFFCRNCGSPMPRIYRDFDLAVVPAGTLDNEPDIAPQARIFWDSRAEWSCADGDLPVFPEYPTGS